MSEWVSVENNSPEFTGTYLVTGSDIEMEFCVFCVDFGWQEEYQITHWMPLPKPPK